MTVLELLGHTVTLRDFSVESVYVEEPQEFYNEPPEVRLCVIVAGKVGHYGYAFPRHTIWIAMEKPV